MRLHGRDDRLGGLRLFGLLCTLLCLLLASAGCRAHASDPAWAPEDLLLLDPLDSRSSAAEILALYSRIRGTDLEIRLDLLDIPLSPDYDLKIWLRLPGDEITLTIPAGGRPSVTSGTPGMQVRVRRDPALDAVTVSLNRHFLPQFYSLRAAAYRSGHFYPDDETAEVRSDALPPVNRAPLLLAFQDVFPAATPAQALRRWDGAHTGPIGGRHGLRYLLAAVETYEIPVVLLDLITPASLAALDFTGSALGRVQKLAARDLLVLPLTACSLPHQVALDFSRQAAQDFNLPASLLVYTCGTGILPGVAFQFQPLADPAHLLSSAGVRLIPVLSQDAGQATPEGVSLPVRRALLEAALSPDPADLVVLGGSLPASNWGTKEMVGASFAWLAGHPWVRVLGAHDLMTFPLGGVLNPPPPLEMPSNPWLPALEAAPQNSLTLSAWKVDMLLQIPGASPALQALRQVYAGQIGILLTAADWAETPVARSDCSSDPDRDGRPECLLSDGRCLAVIETNGGRLTHFFCLDETGAHQLVAPGSQFTIGLSDPSEWHPERGDGADPAALMGAFSDSIHTYDEYLPQAAENAITLTGQDILKTFRLTATGLEVEYRTQQVFSVSIPLALDAHRFYAGQGDYQGILKPGEWTWGLPGGLQVVVRSQADLSAEGFTSARLFLGFPEDPDQQFPAGHYLPFPLAQVRLHAQGLFTTWIEWK